MIGYIIGMAIGSILMILFGLFIEDYYLVVFNAGYLLATMFFTFFLVI